MSIFGKQRHRSSRLLVIGVIATACAMAWPARSAGRYLALIFVREHSLWVRESAGTERQLTRDYEDANPSVSPSGKLLVFERQQLDSEGPHNSAPDSPRTKSAAFGSELWLLDLKTGQRRLLVRAPGDGDCFGPSFDPTGSWVYFQHVSEKSDWAWRGAIAVVKVSTGEWHDLPKLVILPGQNRVEFPFIFPRMTRDSKWVAWSMVPHEGGDTEIYRARPNASGKRTVSRPRRGRGNAASAFWLPTLYLRSGRLACLRNSIDEVGNGRAGLAIIDLQGKAKWRKWIGSLEAYPPPGRGSGRHTGLRTLRRRE